jgi:hypothetical protein
MATTGQRIREHDVVRLRQRVGKWPAAEEGTVLDEKGSWRLVELADDEGVTLDLISVREGDLDVVWKLGWPAPPHHR